MDRKIMDIKRNDKICAGMVLYQPKPKLLDQNIHAIINQVDKLFIFDNISSIYIDADVAKEINSNNIDKAYFQILKNIKSKKRK